MNVIDLYRSDIPTAPISVSGGREYRGPCPVCGGRDRFGVWPEQREGRGSWYCGRFSSGCKGCLTGGDAIDYLRHVRRMSYRQACAYLGISTGSAGASPTAPPLPVKVSHQKRRPEEKWHPEEVVDHQLWRKKCEKFVAACHATLLERSTALDWLAARGIPLSAVKRYRLGFHAGKTVGGKQYQPSFRPWSSWGLRKEMKTNGRERMLVLPAGIVIPAIDAAGEIQRVTIRELRPDPRTPHKKYHYVKGSRRTCWLDTPTATRFTVQEAELDAIALAHATRSLHPPFGHIALGTTGMKPDAATAAALADAQLILGALDYDTPRPNPHTGALESPGAAAGVWWENNYPQYLRWPVPAGKDTGEAYALGVDLLDWIAAALPGHTEERKASSPAAPLPEAAAGAGGGGAEVVEVELAGGRTVYVTDDQSEWRRFAAERRPVFSSEELLRVKAALPTETPPKMRKIANNAICDVKEVFGGYITAGRRGNTRTEEKPAALPAVSFGRARGGKGKRWSVRSARGEAV